VLAAAAPTADWHAFAIAAGTMAVIFTLKRYRPGWPGILLAVVLAALVTALAKLDIATIGTRFGAMPAGLPMPHVPALSTGQGHGRAARRDFLHTARRHRIAALRRGGRRDDRAAAPLQLRTGGAGRGQYRLGPVRRHLCHRHDCADGHECQGRGARSGRGHAALGLPAGHDDRLPRR
jgi:hypothetical protein